MTRVSPILSPNPPSPADEARAEGRPVLMDPRHHFAPPLRKIVRERHGSVVSQRLVSDPERCRLCGRTAEHVYHQDG